MKTISMRFAAFLTVLLLFSCKISQKSAGNGGDDGIIEIQILQMNDVYEISPAPSDSRGGLARVAGIRQELLAKNPNTLTVLAGDFISPSVIGTLKNDNKRIRGKHMVDVLNTLGLDLVVFGNHEFDYDDMADLQSRLDESKFTWLAGNVRQKPPSATPGGTSFTQQFFKNKTGGGTDICPDYKTYTFKDKDGTTLELGIFGVLINTGRKSWAVYNDWMEIARKSYSELEPKCDVVLALTHLEAADDKKLAAMLPKVPLVMGGHDHDNQLHRVGNSVVTKADANAKTVYVHTLRYDKKKKRCTVSSQLRKVDSSLKDEPNTAAVVAKWEKIKDEALLAAGIHPNNVVAELKQPLDCRESYVRGNQAPIGNMITEAMLSVSKNKAECALLNSGSIRVDDVLSGGLSELDIVRILPFGGAVVDVDMKGSLLRKTLEASLGNKGGGGYFQLLHIRQESAGGKWLVADKELDDNRIYHVILPDFLLTGNEANMSFLKAGVGADGKSTHSEMPQILKPDSKDKNDLRNDIRLALIQYLKH